MIGPGGAAGALSVGRGRFSGAVEVGGGGGASYPNRPEGATLLDRWDGSELDLAGWSASWNATRVTVETDTSEPYGNDKVMRFVYGVGDKSCGVRTRSAFDGGPFSEIYFMYRVKYEAGWELIGHKNYFFGVAEGSRDPSDPPTEQYITFEEGHDAKVVTQHVSSANLIVAADAWLGDVGSWVDVEVHAIQESSPGAGDGEVYYYHDGVLLGSNTSVQWLNASDPANGLDGAQWYTTRNDANTIEAAFRISEFSIWGVA